MDNLWGTSYKAPGDHPCSSKAVYLLSSWITQHSTHHRSNQLPLTLFKMTEFAQRENKKRAVLEYAEPIRVKHWRLSKTVSCGVQTFTSRLFFFFLFSVLYHSLNLQDSKNYRVQLVIIDPDGVYWQTLKASYRMRSCFTFSLQRSSPSLHINVSNTHLTWVAGHVGAPPCPPMAMGLDSHLCIYSLKGLFCPFKLNTGYNNMDNAQCTLLSKSCNKNCRKHFIVCVKHFCSWVD